jgi:hypothetical protein
MTKSNYAETMKDMLSRQKARERVAITLANLKLNRNTISTEATMSYKVNIPYRNTDHIFGEAYPHLILSSGQKSAFIRNMLMKIINDGSHMCMVDSDDRYKIFEIDIRTAGRKGYEAALKIESHFPVPPRGTKISNWWHRASSKAAPVKTYLLDFDMYEQVLTWLTENVKPTDYQIYSKFGGDVSIGFQDDSIATMFKLVFAEEDI